MSNGENKTQRTQHAFLVAWGWFGEHLGLPERFEALQLKQKRYHHQPQTQSIGISGVHLGRVGAFAGHQPGGIPAHPVQDREERFILLEP